MNTTRFEEFTEFVKEALLPATTDIGKLAEASRKHVQKLVYTNLVDRFDAMVDGALLDNCRKEHLVDEAMKGMTQAVTEADVVRLLLQGASLQDAIDLRLKDVLRLAVLRQRHSRKLMTLFKVLFRVPTLRKAARTRSRAAERITTCSRPTMAVATVVPSSSKPTSISRRPRIAATAPSARTDR